MRRFVQLLELILALEGLDEGFLGKILSVVDVANYPIDKNEHPP